MVVPARTYFTFSGILGATEASAVEQWSFGLSASDRAFVDNANREAVALAASNAWEAHLKVLHGSNVRLTKVRCASVQPGGLVLRNEDGGYAQGDWTGAWTGSAAGAVAYPPQTALVATLDTARAGASGKGRIFLPMPAFALGADYRISEANAQTAATAVANFIAALDGALDEAGAYPTTKVCVASSKGFLSPVTAVRVGRTLDTLRSRRRDMVEGYARAEVTQ